MTKTLITICALAASFAASAQEGMTVVRDAETGKLRAPTAAELRAMQSKMVQPSLAAPRPKSSVRADGTRSLNLGERGMVYSVVTRSPDGKLVRKCVKDGKAAAEAVEHGEETGHENR